MVGVQAPNHRHLHLHGTSSIHTLAPHLKLVGLFGFVCAVALTPRTAVFAFLIDAIAVAVVARKAHIPWRTLASRLTVVVPFLTVAAFLPFISEGDRIDFLGLSVSADGLWAAWNTAIKALLGATAGVILVATTPIPFILTGLSRLRIPALFVSIISFMFRYLDLVMDELTRMRRAMVARGHDPRWLWQARPIAASAGALFVRTFERGERVHDAMLARGFDGAMPQLGRPHEPESGTSVAALFPASVALAALIVAVLT